MNNNYEEDDENVDITPNTEEIEDVVTNKREPVRNYKTDLAKYTADTLVTTVAKKTKMVEDDSNTTVKKGDDFTKLIGQIGKWQYKVFLLVFLIKFPSGWIQMGVVFLTPSVVYKCAEFEGNATKIAENSTCYKDCLRYDYDTSPFGNTIVSEWDLICERRWLASFTQTILMLGVLVGSALFGFLSDRFGRRYTFLSSIILVVTTGFSIPFAADYYTFTTLRFILGAACGGIMVVSFVIIIESIGPEYRDIFGCIYHVPFNLGYLSVAGFAYYFRDWDTYLLACAVPPVVFLSYVFLVKESPRWLVSVGKVEEATKMVTKIAEINKLPTANIEKTLTALSVSIRNTSPPKTNYLDLFRTPQIRLRTCCSCLIWFINGVCYFGVNQYIGQTSSNPFVSVAAAAAIQIPSNFISLLFLRRYGSKTCITLFFSLAGILLLILGFTPDIFWLNLTLGTLGVSCATVVSAAIYIYSSELFPTVVRNMSMGLCSMSMRVGSMLAPYIATMEYDSWVPSVIFGVSALIGGAISFWVPETKNRVLPDSINDVEKKIDERES